LQCLSGADAGCHTYCSSSALRSYSSCVLHKNFIHSLVNSLLYFSYYSVHPLYLLLCSPLRVPCCVTMLRWYKPRLITSLCYTSHLHCLSITPFSRFPGHPAGTARYDKSVRSSLLCLLQASRKAICRLIVFMLLSLICTFLNQQL